MTQEEKELLLKDLCARLPYGVKYKTYLGDAFTLKDITFSKATTEHYIDDNAFSVGQIKPFLRPMSSMTEEEQFQLGRLMGAASYNMLKGDYSSLEEVLKYVYKNHIDLFGLIPKGLALEAPEGMYK